MGSKPARMTDAGVENVFYFRDRVVRDSRYKLFIDTKRQPEKLIDLEKDPAELNNLIDNPEYKAVLDRLSQAIETFPEMDNDPDLHKAASNPGIESELSLKVHKEVTQIR